MFEIHGKIEKKTEKSYSNMAAHMWRSSSSKNNHNEKRKNRLVGEHKMADVRYGDFWNQENGGNEAEDDRTGLSILDHNTREYLCEIESVVDEGFESQDDKDVFIVNVLKSVSGKEILIAQDSNASRILEKILLCCDAIQVEKYIERISDGLADLCADRCGSHVVQTLLEIIRGHRCQLDKDGDRERPIYEHFVQRIVDIVCADLEQLVVHKYACHVICSLTETLTNTFVSASVHHGRKSHRDSEKKTDYSIENGGSIRPSSSEDKKFKSHFKRLVKAIQQLANFQELARNAHSSTVLQTIVLALSVVNVDSCEQFVTTVTRCLSESDEGLIANSTDPYCTHLVERLVEVSSPKLFEKLIANHFLGHLRELALHSGANFIVQRLFKHCSSKNLFEKMYCELADSWTAIANECHFGVLTSMSEACVRLKACQVKFVADLTKLLKCTDADDRKARFVLLVAQLVPRNEFHDASEEFNVKYHGSLLLQNVLKFQDTNQVMSSLLEMSTGDLTKLFCNSYGSYIMDAFVSSDTISAKSRSKVIQRLADSVVNFACDKYGSRCLEALWRVADLKHKKMYVEKLVTDEDRLKGDRFGSFALSAYAVSLFKRRPDEWAEFQAKRDRKRKAFDEFFDTASDKKRK